jgi:chromosome segregation ATPase
VRCRRDLETLKSVQAEEIDSRLIELQQEADIVRQAAAADAADMARHMSSVLSNHAAEVQELRAQVTAAQASAAATTLQNEKLLLESKAQQSVATKQAAALQADLDHLQLQLDDMRKTAVAEAATAASDLERAEAAVMTERAAVAEKLAASNDQMVTMRATQASLRSQLESKTAELRHAGACLPNLTSS